MMRRLIVISTGLVNGAAAVSLGWLVLPENFLGGFVIFAGLMYSIGGGLFLALGRAPQQTLMAPFSDRTILYLAPGALLVLLGAPLEYHFLPQTLLHSPLMQWLGTLILVLGFSIRLWTRRTLKEDYQGNLQVHPDQWLPGLYRDGRRVGGWFFQPGRAVWGDPVSSGFSSPYPG